MESPWRVAGSARQNITSLFFSFTLLPSADGFQPSDLSNSPLHPSQKEDGICIPEVEDLAWPCAAGEEDLI